MKLTISIRLDNAAFAHQGAEVARILRDVSTDIEDFEDLQYFGANLRDSNGNTVGQAKVTK